MPSASLSAIAAHAQAYGFIYPSSEIYGGLQGVYDYGPYGVALKRNLQHFWWRSMVELHENIVGLDAAILMEPRTWEASGHVAGFHDWMVDNKDSKKRYRVDVLLEEQATKLRASGDEKASEELLAAMGAAMEQEDGDRLRELLVKQGIECPIAKNANWTAVRKFNLMFATTLGAVEDKGSQVYLRPETAQGIFVNFLNVQKRTRLALPFGIAQIGKAFRNELILRQFTFRMREFEQMEMQFFIAPEETTQWFSSWQEKRRRWYDALGIDGGRLRFKPHDQLAHYASAATDITYNFAFGWQEIEGIHARGDFDLRSHSALAKKKLTYFDTKRGTSYIPHVIETSAGCDRLVLMLLAEGLQEKEGRTCLQLPAALAPFQAAIFPLVNKGPIAEKARGIYENLRYDFALMYEGGGSIGKRYARQDLIGTPYCITVDYESLEDGAVTVRDRDSMMQERVHIDLLKDYLTQRTSMTQLLRKLT